ncbi:MAG: DUF4351 domain-containing protein [Magnetococcales bacterium]|nr:DUF4351 domain-containing protein [Magnetococcales bacterium]
MDLGNVPGRELSSPPRLRAWLLAAKYATRNGQQLKVKELLIEVLAKADDDFYFIMRYMIETYQDFGEKTFREIIRRVRPEEEKMMSQFAHEIVEKSKPKWLQQGRQEGRREEAAHMLLSQIQYRFGDVPNRDVEKIKQANLPTLEKRILQIFEAKSLDEVFRP